MLRPSGPGSEWYSAAERPKREVHRRIPGRGPSEEAAEIVLSSSNRPGRCAARNGGRSRRPRVHRRSDGAFGARGARAQEQRTSVGQRARGGWADGFAVSSEASARRACRLRARRPPGGGARGATARSRRRWGAARWGLLVAARCVSVRSTAPEAGDWQNRGELDGGRRSSGEQPPDS